MNAKRGRSGRASRDFCSAEAGSIGVPLGSPPKTRGDDEPPGEFAGAGFRPVRNKNKAESAASMKTANPAKPVWIVVRSIHQPETRTMIAQPSDPQTRTLPKPDPVPRVARSASEAAAGSLAEANREFTTRAITIGMKAVCR